MPCLQARRWRAATGTTLPRTPRSRGPQFRDAFRAWCALYGIRPRFGAVGRHGSIAVLERFILSMKTEALRRILVPLGIADMRIEIARYAVWYNEHRPRSPLCVATKFANHAAR